MTALRHCVGIEPRRAIDILVGQPDSDVPVGHSDTPIPSHQLMTCRKTAARA